MASGDRIQRAMYLVEKSVPIAPLEREVAFCVVALDPVSAEGNPATREEERIAASLIHPSAVVGKKVLVEYIEGSHGLRRAIRIGPALDDAPEN